MSQPVLSLVIPCYDSAATLERTLQSLERQNYPALQLILMDGGSRDGTMDIVQKHRRLFHTIISEPDRGQTNAINKGFRVATGDVFGWLCADDELMPDALAHVGDSFARNPSISFLTGGCERVFADSTRLHTVPPPEMWARLGYQNLVEEPSTFWRAALHRAAGELDESYYFAFDWDWWNRLKKAGAVPHVTPQILSRYHFSDTNKTSNGARKLVREMRRVMKHHAPLRGFLGDIYYFLYLNFDLHGCYDNPPTCTPVRAFFFKHAIRPLLKLFGREYIYCYNWNFASKQERSLVWWK